MKKWEKYLREKSKSCKRDAFVFACKWRLMQVRNLKAHKTISGLSARKSVFCWCCQSCLHLSSLYWTSLWFILSSWCSVLASNYFPICFQTLTACQHCTDAQTWESLDYKMPPPRQANVHTKGTHVNRQNTCRLRCQKIGSFNAWLRLVVVTKTRDTKIPRSASQSQDAVVIYLISAQFWSSINSELILNTLWEDWFI